MQLNTQTKKCYETRGEGITRYECVFNMFFAYERVCIVKFVYVGVEKDSLNALTHSHTAKAHA